MFFFKAFWTQDGPEGLFRVGMDKTRLEIKSGQTMLGLLSGENGEKQAHGLQKWQKAAKIDKIGKIGLNNTFFCGTGMNLVETALRTFRLTSVAHL